MHEKISGKKEIYSIVIFYATDVTLSQINACIIRTKTEKKQLIYKRFCQQTIIKRFDRIIFRLVQHFKCLSWANGLSKRLKGGKL